MHNILANMNDCPVCCVVFRTMSAVRYTQKSLLRSNFDLNCQYINICCAIFDLVISAIESYYIAVFILRHQDSWCWFTKINRSEFSNKCKSSRQFLY